MEMEDLRGRTLRWRYVSGFPLDVQLGDGSQNAGRLWKPTNHRPDWRATLAGIDWRIHDHMATKQIGFVGSEFWLGHVDMVHLGLGERPMPKAALLDGTRTYRFRFVAPHRTDVIDERKTTVLHFRREWSGDSITKDGRIEVSSACELLDAPPLALLSVLLAVTGGLFTNDPHPRYED